MSEQAFDQTFDPEKIRRLFGSPLHIPPEFKSWMIDQMVLNIPDLPVGQAFQGRNLAKLIAHSASATTGVTATSTSPTTLYTFTLPKGSLSQNGRLEINEHVQISCNDVSNEAEQILYMNGTEVARFPWRTAFLDGNVVDASLRWVIQNRNSYASQVAYGTAWFPATGQYIGTITAFLSPVSAIDTTANVTVECKMDWLSGGSQNFAHRFFTASVYNPARFA